MAENKTEVAVAGTENVAPIAAAKKRRHGVQKYPNLPNNVGRKYMRATGQGCSALSIDEFNAAVNEFCVDLANKAADASKHAGRKSVKDTDVVFALGH